MPGQASVKASQQRRGCAPFYEPHDLAELLAGMEKGQRTQTGWVRTCVLPVRERSGPGRNYKFQGAQRRAARGL